MREGEQTEVDERGQREAVGRGRRGREGGEGQAGGDWVGWEWVGGVGWEGVRVGGGGGSIVRGCIGSTLTVFL